MRKFRLVQRNKIFYPQTKRFYLFWLYTTDIPDGIECKDFIIDKFGCIGFKNFKDSKIFLNDLANSKKFNKTKVVYELEEADEEEEND